MGGAPRPKYKTLGFIFVQDFKTLMEFFFILYLGRKIKLPRRKVYIFPNTISYPFCTNSANFKRNSSWTPFLAKNTEFITHNCHLFGSPGLIPPLLLCTRPARGGPPLSVPRQVLVHMLAAPVTRLDRQLARFYALHDTAMPPFPAPAGTEGVGVVLRVGPGVETLKEGGASDVEAWG